MLNVNPVNISATLPDGAVKMLASSDGITVGGPDAQPNQAFNELFASLQAPLKSLVQQGELSPQEMLDLQSQWQDIEAMAPDDAADAITNLATQLGFSLDESGKLLPQGTSPSIIAPVSELASSDLEQVGAAAQSTALKGIIDAAIVTESDSDIEDVIIINDVELMIETEKQIASSGSTAEALNVVAAVKPEQALNSSAANNTLGVASVQPSANLAANTGGDQASSEGELEGELVETSFESSETKDESSFEKILKPLESATADKSKKSDGVAPNRPLSTSLSTPLESKGWDLDLGNRLSWLAGNKIQSAEITVNPANMGPIKIELNLQEDQIQIQIQALQSVTREVVEAAIPRLREMMNEAGFNRVDVDVTQESEQHFASQNNDSEQQHGQGQGNNAAANGQTQDSESQARQQVIDLEKGIVDAYA